MASRHHLRYVRNQYAQKNELPPFSEPEELIFTAHEELLASLSRITLYRPPVQTCSTGWHFNGLYAGPTSIAYLFLRLHILFLRHRGGEEFMFKGQSLLDWAQSYLELGRQYFDAAGNAQPAAGARSRKTNTLVDPDRCGIANESLAQLSLRIVIEQDVSLVERLCSYANILAPASSLSSSSSSSSSSQLQTESSGSNEWLYGRAGYLYFLRLARSAFNNDSSQSNPLSSASKVNNLVNAASTKIIHQILCTPQPWIWHDKAYLGAAHGYIGILTQIILSSSQLTSHSEILAQISPLLSSLIALQFSKTGNFPSSLDSASRDELVQFCHGSPGFLLCLSSIYPFFTQPLDHDDNTEVLKPSSVAGGGGGGGGAALAAAAVAAAEMPIKIESAILAARNDIWHRGLLTKNPCLCHGVAGNALALAFSDPSSFSCHRPVLSSFKTSTSTSTSPSTLTPKTLPSPTQTSTYFLQHHLSTASLESNGWLDIENRQSTNAQAEGDYAGLYEGEAGRAWVWGLAALDLLGSSMTTMTTGKGEDEDGREERRRGREIDRDGRGCLGFNDL